MIPDSIRVAAHEAAHATIALHLGKPVHWAMAGGTEGAVTLAAWTVPEWREVVLWLMAGEAGEDAAPGVGIEIAEPIPQTVREQMAEADAAVLAVLDEIGNPAPDRIKAALVAGQHLPARCVPDYLGYAATHAACILSEHVELFHALAHELHRHHRLDGQDIAALVARCPGGKS